MSEWHRKASELLPQFQKEISSSGTPMTLWLELQIKFGQALEKDDSKTIDDMIKLAKFFLKSKNDDLVQAVHHGFLEDLPEIPKARELFPKWFSKSEFLALREIFEYHAGTDMIEEILKKYGK